MYTVSSGGDVGRGNNGAIRLIATPGAAPPEGEVVISELTTVIAAFSVNRWSLDGGVPNDQGLEMYRQLIDPATGAFRPIFNRGANSPALVNTVADILHGCVISSGPKSRECQALLAIPPPWPTGKRPENTLEALKNMLSVSGQGNSGLFALLPKEQPYAPVLDRPPLGWFLSLNFNGIGLNHPTEMLADWSDDTLWILNRGNESLIELSTDPAELTKPLLGVRKLPAAVRKNPASLWFTGWTPAYPRKARPNPPGWPSVPSAWIANDEFVWLNKEAVPCQRSSSTLGLKGAGGMSICTIFGYGLCIANSGMNEIVEVKLPATDHCESSGIEVLGRLHNATPGCGVVGHDVCVANTDRNGNILKPPALALVEPGHIVGNTQNWVTNRANNSVSSFHDFYDAWPTGPGVTPTVFFHQLTVLPGSPFRDGSIADPEGAACDREGHVWIANHASNANRLTELESYSDNQHSPELRSLSPAMGFYGVGMNRPYGVAVDLLGNVWVSNEGNDSLTVLIGAGQSP